MARWFQLEAAANGTSLKRVPRPPRSPIESRPKTTQQQPQRRRKPKRDAWESDGKGEDDYGGKSDGSDEASGERYVPPTLRSRRLQRNGVPVARQ